MWGSQEISNCSTPSSVEGNNMIKQTDVKVIPEVGECGRVWRCVMRPIDTEEVIECI